MPTSSECVPIEPARRGRPRTSIRGSAGAVVRVELRLPSDVAAQLYERAQQTGQSVSGVGADALAMGLAGGAM